MVFSFIVFFVVVCTILYLFVRFFLSTCVTSGWIFDISLCENSINQSINQRDMPHLFNYCVVWGVAFNSVFVKWRTDFFFENEKRQLNSCSQFQELFLIAGLTSVREPWQLRRSSKTALHRPFPKANSPPNAYAWVALAHAPPAAISFLPLGGLQSLVALKKARAMAARRTTYWGGLCREKSCAIKLCTWILPRCVGYQVCFQV